MWETKELSIIITQSGSLNIFISRNFAGSEKKSDFYTDVRASIWKPAASRHVILRTSMSSALGVREAQEDAMGLTGYQPSRKTKLQAQRDILLPRCKGKNNRRGGFLLSSVLLETQSYIQHVCIHTHTCTHTKKTLQLILFEYEIKMVSNVGFSVKTQLLSSFFHVY